VKGGKLQESGVPEATSGKERGREKIRGMVSPEEDVAGRKRYTGGEISKLGEGKSTSQ